MQSCISGENGYNRLVITPDKVLIGGGISRQARLVPDIHAQYERIRKAMGVQFDLPCHLEVCWFGNEANQYGALYHFLTQNAGIK